MYVFARLISVFTYCIVLLVFCNGIYACKTGSSKRWLTAYCVAIGIMGFVIVPYESNDLFRLMDEYRVFYAYGFSDFVAYLTKGVVVNGAGNPGTLSPVVAGYYWLISRIGVDGLLPAINGMIVYGLLFSCIADFEQRFGVSQKNTAITVFFLMSTGTFLMTVSDFKNFLGFSIVMWCVYGEFVKGKSAIMDLPFYLLALLFHKAVAVVVFARFAILLFEPTTLKGRKMVNIVTVLVVVMGAAIVGVGYIEEVFLKANTYLTTHVMSYAWEYAIHILILLVCVMTLASAKGLSKPEEGEVLRSYWAFCVLVCLICLAVCFEYTMFHRFTTFLSYICVPFVMVAMQERDRRYKGRAISRIPIVNYKSALVFGCLVMLFLACFHGDLNTYKFL